MSFFYFFAHAGEQHTTTAEAASHAAEATITSGAVFWLVLLICPTLLLLLFQLFKLQFSTRLLLLSVFLIVYSIISYQHPGIYSALSLSIGFGIVLFLSISGLAAE